jgi:hypothetical protein
VILGVDPEDGDGGDLVIARDLLRKLHRRQRFQQREERSAKQPGLLSGDDGDRAGIGEEPSGLARARRRLTSFLLAGDDGGNLGAASIVRLGPGNRLGPGGAVRRVAGKKRRDRAEVVCVVRRQPANPWKPPHIHREPDSRAV